MKTPFQLTRDEEFGALGKYALSSNNIFENIFIMTKRNLSGVEKCKQNGSCSKQVKLEFPGSVIAFENEATKN